MNSLTLFQITAQHTEDSVVFLAAGSYAGVDIVLELSQLLCHGGVKDNHGSGAVSRRADGTELEAVACESEGRRTVAVGVVDE